MAEVVVTYVEHSSQGNPSLTLAKNPQYFLTVLPGKTYSGEKIYIHPESQKLFQSLSEPFRVPQYLYKSFSG